EEQPTVRHNGMRKRQACCHQKRRPVDAVKADNFFANHLQIGRPVLLKLAGIARSVAERRNVIRERVQPDINHMSRIIGHRDAPLKGAAADRQIAQAAANKRNHLVAARLRANELGPAFVELQQLVLKSRKLEKVVFFANGFCWPSALGAGSAGSSRIDVQLVEDAVLTRVGALVDVTAIADLAPERLHSKLVALGGGANEIVVGESHAVPKSPELPGHFVGKLLWSFSGSLRGPFDLLTVLVGSCEKERVGT